MAYFDNPENATMWEKELGSLRAERSRRQTRTTGQSPDGKEPVAANIHEQAHEAHKPEAAPLMREPITFAQLEIDAGVRKAPVKASAPEPERQKEPVHAKS